MREIDDALKWHLLQKAETKSLHVDLFPPLSHSLPLLYITAPKATATESKDNHSGVLICPLDILFAKKGPWRGLSPKEHTALLNQPRIT